MRRHPERLSLWIISREMNYRLLPEDIKASWTERDIAEFFGFREMERQDNERMRTKYT